MKLSLLCISAACAGVLFASSDLRAQGKTDPAAPRYTPIGGKVDPDVIRNSETKKTAARDAYLRSSTLVNDRVALMRYIRRHVSGDVTKMLRASADLAMLTDPSIASPSRKSIEHAAGQIAKVSRNLREALTYEAIETDSAQAEPSELNVEDRGDLQQTATDIAILVDELAGLILPEFLDGNVVSVDAQANALQKLRRLEELAKDLKTRVSRH